jgi:xanthine dehydrogenase accessory factor
MEEAIWREIHPKLVSAAGEAFIDIAPAGGPGPAPWNAYLESIKPLPKLLIAGGGHVGKALSHLGALLDFEVTVIDDREAFACSENIPDADHFMHGDIGSSMQSVNPGPDHYIVIVTRGHLRDSEALKACIGSPAAYVGMIGSRNKVAVMKEKFLEAGWATVEQWGKVHTPIGLPIGSKTVQEIAVSIAAELVQARDHNRPKHAP